MSSSTSGHHLLSSSYKCFRPMDIGDRYVRFLLQNERTMSILQTHVLADHLDGSRSSGSLEIDAFQLLSLDPVLGNLTLRYPDTLLELLQDATIPARRVLRRRIHVALEAALANMPNDDRDKPAMSRLLLALQRSQRHYEPRPLSARLVRLPPHKQCCQPTLSALTAAQVGTVIQISGTCVRTGPVRMMETMRVYRCLGRGCGSMVTVSADFGTANNALLAPMVCPRSRDWEGDFQCSAAAGSFEVVRDASQHVDYQEMKVQESASALTAVGSVPRSILIKLTDDLVDKCHPGDEVVVVGSFQAEWQSTTASGGYGENLEIMVGTSIRAHSVRVINVDEEVGSRGGLYSAVGDLAVMADSGRIMGALAATSGNLRDKFTREFDSFWSQEAAKRWPIATRDYILRAVCPKLYGMHAVKLGLLLVLIGGASVWNKKDSCQQEDAVELEHDRTSGEVSKKENWKRGAGPVAFKIGRDYCEDDDDDRTKLSSKIKENNDTITDNRQDSNKLSKMTVRSRRRIQSHILLIGDPGTGKSQFLRFAAALSPRSVLTTGTGSSTAGLTCAAVRDSSAGSNGNEFSLEAGALALADRGVCCIDEFGCMSKEDRTSIHEAMEQQTISVAKAGIICKLNARATIVAVMNPSGGIYDETSSLEHNSRLGSALLSRFDLIFVMLDQAECRRDENIADFLLQQSITPGSGYDCSIEGKQPFDKGDVNGHWNIEKLRAYIVTVREKFHPTMTQAASQLLENHYSLCRQSQSDNLLPITVRFLESLIRLSQAHARLMYRNTVLLEDAIAVILLMDYTATAYQNHDDYPSGHFLFKNPVDSEFRPYHTADAEFEEQKQRLLQRYRNSKPHTSPSDDWRGRTKIEQQGRGDPRFFTQLDSHQRGDSQLFTPHNPCELGAQKDQWGRQILSQVTTTKFSSQGQNSIDRMTDSPDPTESTQISGSKRRRSPD